MLHVYIQGLMELILSTNSQNQAAFASIGAMLQNLNAQLVSLKEQHIKRPSTITEEKEGI